MERRTVSRQCSNTSTPDLIGLTAKHTYGFFNQDVVMEYPAGGRRHELRLRGLARICSTIAAVGGPTAAPQRMRP
jgi:hypothetical protein